MKKIVAEFFRKGLISCGFGPIILAVIYSILNILGVIDTLSASEVCIGIFSLAFLAFIAGGMNVLYQIERLPFMKAMFIHGLTLYLAYFATYLLNGWMERQILPILVFTVIFVVGYLIIWAIIYSLIKKNTDKLNEIFKEKEKNSSQI